MKNLVSALLLLFVSVTQTALADNANEAGKFDTYVLAMSYENDFCATHGSKKECQTAQDYGIVLHGLWPNLLNDPRHTYQYCGLSKAEFGNDWCATQTDVTPKLDFFTKLALYSVMPGAESCLHNHEWYAHGTCSGLDANGYFRLSATLAWKFRIQPTFSKFLKDSAGKQVSRDEILAAVAADIAPNGEDVSKSILVQCRKKKGKAYFTELHLTLVPAKVDSFPALESLGPSEGFGSCPRSGIYIY